MSLMVILLCYIPADCPSGYQISASNVNQCDICPRNQFRNKATSTTCQPCPNGLIAAAEGATAASECIYGDCQAGSYINGSSCVTCPTDSYQDERWQTSCKGCRFDSANNDQYRTASPGATRASDCQSTNECNSAATNNCHSEHGICTNTLDSFTCSCKTGFVGDGVTCTDICDTGYCLNNATCTKSGNIYSMPTCVCREYYEGVTCAVRLPITNSHEWDYIVGFSIGGVILFIFIILLLMLICWCARRADKRRKYKSPMDPYNHVYDNPMHITNGKPLFDQHSVAPSYSMHTTRDPSRSYMFYEERDDQPVAPLSETLHRNETFRASEVQGDTFNFGDEDGYVTPVATAMGGGNVGGEPVADSEPEVRIEAGLSDPGTA
ncbi:delta-like protein 1 [Lingula anatina]|uniref:Delta-like protein 1 n=1 Tax=Lingula anatina TaxID=7574 RepID=A0A1S3H3L7_LINAN|nr:delta-like protein 1 [Lingula anatina]|eukprot:XP_013380061.1 delta-like protein 1 [Lingula anatina]